MKTKLHFAIFLLLLIPFSAFTQAYLQTPSTGARWKIEEEANDGTILIQNIWAYYLYSDGDTNVAGYLVTKINTGQIAECPSSGGWFSPSFSEGQIMYFYQDSSGRLSEVDTLGNLYTILDYSLNAGDSLPVFYPGGGSGIYVVDSTDSVTYADGVQRKRLYVHADFMVIASPTIWVEGIGDIYHGPRPIPEFENYMASRCYKEDSLILINGNPFHSSCPGDCDILLRAEEVTSPKFSLFPNPSNGTWKLETQVSTSNIEIQVMDLHGKIVWEKQYLDAGATEIKLKSAPSGIYFARIKVEGMNTQTLKLRKY